MLPYFYIQYARCVTREDKTISIDVVIARDVPKYLVIRCKTIATQYIFIAINVSKKVQSFFILYLLLFVELVTVLFKLRMRVLLIRITAEFSINQKTLVVLRFMLQVLKEEVPDLIPWTNLGNELFKSGLDVLGSDLE